MLHSSVITTGSSEVQENTVVSMEDQGRNLATNHPRRSPQAPVRLIALFDDFTFNFQTDCDTITENKAIELPRNRRRYASTDEQVLSGPARAWVIAFQSGMAVCGGMQY